MGIVTAVKRVEFISDRLYITLKFGWYDIALIVHAPTEDESDVTKDSLL
jgi:hypothetical protein